jgi:hypothetical protein
MGEVPPLGQPPNTLPPTQEELERLQADLVSAQAAEIVAISALSDYTRAARFDEDVLAHLLADVHTARERAVNAYDAWNAATKAFYGVAS